jgi:hypothetical protein
MNAQTANPPGELLLNLPFFTSSVLIGVPVFWILYTVGFMWVSRHWAREDEGGPE